MKIKDRSGVYGGFFWTFRKKLKQKKKLKLRKNSSPFFAKNARYRSFSAIFLSKTQSTGVFLWFFFQNSRYRSFLRFFDCKKVDLDQVKFLPFKKLNQFYKKNPGGNLKKLKRFSEKTQGQEKIQDFSGKNSTKCFKNSSNRSFGARRTPDIRPKKEPEVITTSNIFHI